MASAKTPSAISNTAVDGRPILLTDTATPGQVIYTVATSGPGDWVDVTVEGWHTDAGAAHTIVIEVIDTDGTTVLATVSQSVPALSGPVVLISNWRLRNGLSIAAWEATGGVAYVKVEYDLRRP